MCRLSVAICTHDRSSRVLACLSTLYKQMDFSRSELIVVDSASSERESGILEAALPQFPEMKAFRLLRHGLSAARNLAIKESTGTWIAFLDDDVVPAPDWYRQLDSVLDRAPDDCAAIGGRVRAVYPIEKEAALGKRWKAHISANDHAGEVDCTAEFTLAGANSCFRAAALNQVGGFSPELGRVEASVLGGAEIMALRRLRDLGWRIRFQGQFSVDHELPPDSLRLGFLCKRAYWEGITAARVGRLRNEPDYARLVAKALINMPADGLFSIFTGSGQDWDLRFWRDCGVLAETLRLAPKVEHPEIAGSRLLSTVRGIVMGRPHTPR